MGTAPVGPARRGSRWRWTPHTRGARPAGPATGWRGPGVHAGCGLGLQFGPMAPLARLRVCRRWEAGYECASPCGFDRVAGSLHGAGRQVESDRNAGRCLASVSEAESAESPGARRTGEDRRRGLPPPGGSVRGPVLHADPGVDCVRHTASPNRTAVSETRNSTARKSSISAAWSANVRRIANGECAETPRARRARGCATTTLPREERSGQCLSGAKSR